MVIDNIHTNIRLIGPIGTHEGRLVFARFLPHPKLWALEANPDAERRVISSEVTYRNLPEWGLSCGSVMWFVSTSGLLIISGIGDDIKAEILAEIL
jgi:hypothetical protein